MRTFTDVPRALQPGDYLMVDGQRELVLHRTVTNFGTVVTVARPAGSWTRLLVIPAGAQVAISRG